MTLNLPLESLCDESGLLLHLLARQGRLLGVVALAGGLQWQDWGLFNGRGPVKVTGTVSMTQVDHREPTP